jgi:mannose-6-phosphate isomerase-like protein (cupin superfamily)
VEIIKQVNEKDFEFRGGESGVKYLMRGPSIDWGIIKLKPGEMMAEKAHGHHIIDETFYFVEGGGKMIVNDKEYNAPEGSVFLIEPKETHNIKNTSDETIRVVFIKGEYKPDDKF